MNQIDVWAYPHQEKFLVHFISSRAKEWASCHLQLKGWDKISPIAFTQEEYGELCFHSTYSGLQWLFDDTGVEH